MDQRQIRFQHMGNGMLNRVEPYFNQATTTGIEPVENPAWLDAIYGLSYLWHPMSIKVFTKSFTKINEKVPTVNSAMYGQWGFIDDNPLMPPQPDGTMCDPINNDDHTLFYWKCNLYAGFQMKYAKFLYPIIHLLDGSGKCSTTDQPVCCDEPVYTAQQYSNSPIVCSET